VPEEQAVRGAAQVLELARVPAAQVAEALVTAAEVPERVPAAEVPLAEEAHPQQLAHPATQPT
jgi:hypothetical protein